METIQRLSLSLSVSSVPSVVDDSRLTPARPLCYAPRRSGGCRAGLSKGADMRRILASLVACCLVGSWATAQTATPAKMAWQAGQVYSYRIEHTTQATDSVGDSKSETKSVMRAVRDWKVHGRGRRRRRDARDVAVEHVPGADDARRRDAGVRLGRPREEHAGAEGRHEEVPEHDARRRSASMPRARSSRSSPRRRTPAATRTSCPSSSCCPPPAWRSARAGTAPSRSPSPRPWAPARSTTPCRASPASRSRAARRP